MFILLHRSNTVRWDNDLVPVDIGTGVTAGITIPDILNNNRDEDRGRKDHGWVEGGSQVSKLGHYSIHVYRSRSNEDEHEDACVNPRYGYSTSTSTHHSGTDNLRPPLSIIHHHTTNNNQTCVNEYNAPTTVNPLGGDVVSPLPLSTDRS